MRIIKTIGAVLLAVLCCPETFCDGAVRVQVDDINDARLMVELPVILKAAHRNDCHGPNLLILLAIRKAENGQPGLEFGIKHPKCLAQIEAEPAKSLDIQAGWAAATIVKNKRRWIRSNSENDFIEFLGNRYCPKETDPEGNKNWKRNVRYFYNKFKRE